jgi:hypothetical protein
MALRSRLTRCNGPDWGHRFTCRSPACPACRDRYIAKQRREALKRFAGVPTNEMALLTIVLPPVLNLADIDGTMAKARRDMRNLINRQRHQSAMWGPVEVLVWLEIDAFDLEDFARLGSDRQKQVSEFIQPFHGQTGTVWVASLHGVLRLAPALDVGVARSAFERQWPGHRRVYLETFTEGKAMTASLGDIINYSLKHENTNDFIDYETGEVIHVEWEDSMLSEFYSWMYGWSRGFQSTRLSVNMKKNKRSKTDDVAVFESSDDDVLVGLPCLYGFSVFDRDYTY